MNLKRCFAVAGLLVASAFQLSDKKPQASETLSEKERQEIHLAFDKAGKGDWGALASSFKFSQELFDAEETRLGWKSQERLNRIIDAYKNFLDLYGRNPLKACLSGADAYKLAVDNKTNTDSHWLNKFGVTEQQDWLLRVLHIAVLSPESEAVVVQAVSSGAVLCVNESLSELDGFFDGQIISLNLKNKNLVHTSEEVQFTNSFLTFMEEMAHAAQYNMDIYDPKNPETLARADYKMWNLLTEAHAKIIAARSLMEMTILTPTSLVQLGQLDLGDKTLIEHVISSYVEHGRTSINENPEILAQGMEAFLQSGTAMEGYYTQYCNIVNQLPASGGRRLSIAEFRKAFGQLPGATGNMLSEFSANATMEDLIKLIPEGTRMRQWFDAALEAEKQGKPVPDLAPEVPGCKAEAAPAPLQ